MAALVPRDWPRLAEGFIARELPSRARVARVRDTDSAEIRAGELLRDHLRPALLQGLIRGQTRQFVHRLALDQTVEREKAGVSAFVR